MLVLYHADDEFDRVADPLTIAGLALLAVAGLLLVAGAPTGDGGRRLTAKLALFVALAGLSAHLALGRMGGEEWDEGARLRVAWAAFTVQAASFFLALPLALAAYLRGQGKLAAAALSLSLVLPLLFAVWVFACGVTDACFH